MTTENVVNKYYTHLLKKEFHEVINLFAEKVTWRIPGNAERAPWIKDRNSKAEVSEFFKELYSYLEGVSFTINDQFFLGNKAVVTGHLVSRILSTGKLFDSHFTAQFTVENGLITDYLMLEDSYQLVETLKK